MPGRTHSTWLQRLLFRLACVVSALLIVLVILSPMLDNDRPKPAGWPRLVAVFARDATLRRTALASAIGLLVTACIFFRPPTPQSVQRKPKQPRLPPPPDIAGA